MPLPLRITMDGTAGCGKSTTGQLLAKRLGYTFFDTGKLYRAIARQVENGRYCGSNFVNLSCHVTSGGLIGG